MKAIKRIFSSKKKLETSTSEKSVALSSSHTVNLPDDIWYIIISYAYKEHNLLFVSKYIHALYKRYIQEFTKDKIVKLNYKEPWTIYADNVLIDHTSIAHKKAILNNSIEDQIISLALTHNTINQYIDFISEVKKNHIISFGNYLSNDNFITSKMLKAPLPRYTEETLESQKNIIEYVDSISFSIPKIKLTPEQYSFLFQWIKIFLDNNKVKLLSMDGSLIESDQLKSVLESFKKNSIFEKVEISNLDLKAIDKDIQEIIQSFVPSTNNKTLRKLSFSGLVSKDPIYDTTSIIESYRNMETDSIYLENLKLHKEHINLINEILKANPNITKLSFKGSEIQDKTADTSDLVNIVVSSNIKTLCISKSNIFLQDNLLSITITKDPMNISQTHFSSIYKIIKESQALKKLSINDTNLSKGNLESIYTGLQHRDSKNFKELKLNLQSDDPSIISYRDKILQQCKTAGIKVK